MRKLIAILLSVLLLMNMSFVIAFAADDISLNVVFDGEEKSYTINGYINNTTRDRIPMTLVIKHRMDVNNTPENISDDTVMIVDVLTTLAEGKTTDGVAFKFEPVYLIDSTLTGYIDIEVTTSYLPYSASASVEFCGVDSYFNALTIIKNAIDSGHEETLKNAVLSTGGLLSVDTTAFSALTDDAANLKDATSIALKNIFLLKLELPTSDDGDYDTTTECYDTDEECEQIMEQVSVYQSTFKEAIALGNFFDLATKDDLKSWYDLNKETYGFLLDDSDTLVDETKFLSYFDEAIAKDGFISRIENITFVETIKELNVEMKNQAILHMVSVSNQNVVDRVLTDFSAALTNVNDVNGLNPISVNYAAWNTLTLQQQSTVCVNIAGQNYYDFYAFIGAINNEINNIFGSGTNIYEKNQGGGDRGGSKNPVAVPVQPQSSSVNIMKFEDIQNVAWATEAIRYLYSNGIISGRDEQIFDPNNMVTRAELAKMLVLGLNLSGEGKISFSDVSEDDWYAKYVSIAAANGLIFGDDNGRFNPNAPVSRQDAAVMMYRSVKTNTQTQSSKFEDYSMISSYAIDAIDYMSYEGIVDGVGDGYFAPLANITRAQAAKMLYSFLLS